MFRDVGLVALSDLVIVIVLCGLLYPKANATIHCSTSLFVVGACLIAYQIFFVVRNVLIMACCVFNRNPDRRAMICRFGMTVIDSVCLTTFIVWSFT